MKILMVSHYCDPEPNMTRGLIFARKLVSLGHDVEILTGFPNYPNGKVYPGYRIKLLQREHVDGVTLLRVPMYPSHDPSALRRVANYASFGLSAAVLGSVFAKKPDVIYVWHPPLTTGLAASVLGVTKRAPFVYDVQDLWPDTLEATGMVTNRRLLRVVHIVARYVYRRASRIVVQSPGFRSALIQRGVDASKIDVIYNWAHEGVLRLERDAALAKQLDSDTKFNVVFAGTIGKAQGLETVLAAASQLEESNPDVQIVLAGGGVEADRLNANAKERRLSNVTFIPRLPVDRIGTVMETADALLIHLKDEPLFRITIPNKAQDYLYVGKPIVLAGRGEVESLISASRGGITCPPDDPMALALAIQELASLDPSARKQMGIRGGKYYERTLSMQIGVEQFERVFEEALEGRQASTDT